MIYQNKNKYQSMLLTYTQRRDEIRKKFGPSWRKNPKYREDTRHLSNRINAMRQQIKRIEVRRQQVHEMAGWVYDFLDISLVGNEKPLRFKIYDTGKKITMARNLLCKYALENGVYATILADWLGCKYSQSIQRTRRRFTRSFQHNSENKKTWEDFKFFIKTNYSGGSEYLEAA